MIEPGQGIAVEAAAFERAREAVRARLAPLAKEASPTARELIAAHIEILEDPELIGAARALISAGKSAAFRLACGAAPGGRSIARDRRCATRGARGRSQRSRATGADRARRPDAVARAAIPPGTILLAKEMTPSQLIELEGGKPAGICLVAGGPTSHVAVLAASLGIPMIVAVGPKLHDIRAGTTLALDADAGSCALRRTSRNARQFESRNRIPAGTPAPRARSGPQRRAAPRVASASRCSPISAPSPMPQFAVAHGAEGCGLLRTEFLFLDRASAPDEREQRETYQRIAQVLEGRPLVIRTLDVGGDKPLAYLPLPAEENPALGLRGIRVSLWRPELLRAQLRALLAVEPAGQCRILLPMITGSRRARTRARHGR